MTAPFALDAIIVYQSVGYVLDERQHQHMFYVYRKLDKNPLAFRISSNF
jgi:hypothetical protein